MTNIPENIQPDNKEIMSARQPESGSVEKSIDARVIRENLNKPERFLDNLAGKEKLGDISSRESDRRLEDTDTSSDAFSYADHLDKFVVGLNVSEVEMEKLQKLINITFEKGPEEAVETVRGMNDPFMSDALHRLLTTEWMHKILVERGLIKEPK